MRSVRGQLRGWAAKAPRGRREVRTRNHREEIRYGSGEANQRTNTAKIRNEANSMLRLSLFSNHAREPWKRFWVLFQVIDIEVDLTTNHWGRFALKLCPVSDRKTIVTQECLDEYPLHLANDPTKTEFEIPSDVKKKAYLVYKVKLPAGVTCNQCVIQWTYYTGKYMLFVRGWMICDYENNRSQKREQAMHP